MVEKLLKDLHLRGYVILQNEGRKEPEKLPYNEDELNQTELTLKTVIVLTDEFYKSVAKYAQVLVRLLSVSTISRKEMDPDRSLAVVRAAFTFQVTENYGRWMQFIRSIGQLSKCEVSDFSSRTVESSEHWLIFHSIWINHLRSQGRKGASGDDLRQILTGEFKTHVVAEDMDRELEFLADEAGVLSKNHSERFIINEPFRDVFDNYASDLFELRHKLKKKLQEAARLGSVAQRPSDKSS